MITCHDRTVQRLFDRGPERIQDSGWWISLTWEEKTRLNPAAERAAEYEQRLTTLDVAAASAPAWMVRILLGGGVSTKGGKHPEHTTLGGDRWPLRIGIVVARRESGYGSARQPRAESAHLAVIGGHQYTVEALLERNADIEARTQEGETVLHWAAVRGDSGVVEYLLNRGAEIVSQ